MFYPFPGRAGADGIPGKDGRDGTPGNTQNKLSYHRMPNLCLIET